VHAGFLRAPLDAPRKCGERQEGRVGPPGPLRA